MDFKAIVVDVGYRLYEDELDSFIFGVIPEDVLIPNRSEYLRYSGVHPEFVLSSDHPRYSVLTSLSTSGLWKKIAVPSRLYAKQTAEQPLAGSQETAPDPGHLVGLLSQLQVIHWARIVVQACRADYDHNPGFCSRTRCVHSMLSLRHPESRSPDIRFNCSLSKCRIPGGAIIAQIKMMPTHKNGLTQLSPKARGGSQHCAKYGQRPCDAYPNLHHFTRHHVCPRAERLPKESLARWDRRGQL